MSVLNPTGRTVMSGTYTGHLTAVLGAIACQTELAKPDFYPHITRLADRLYRGIADALARRGIPGIVQGIGARFGVYFGLTDPVTSYRQAALTNRDLEGKFILGCVKRGLYIHDYGHTMHHGFSAQHTEADIDQALDIIAQALRDM
jgi:glutamate-1-semialdehyde 2,1-aminomutase